MSNSEVVTVCVFSCVKAFYISLHLDDIKAGTYGKMCGSLKMTCVIEYRTDVKI